VSLVPSPGLSVLGGLRLPDGRCWGKAATEVQLADAARILDPDAPVRRSWLGRARGYSKTTDLAGMTLAAMATGIIPPGGRGYVCAGDEDQATLTINAARGFVQRSPGLEQLFTIERRRILGPNDTQVQVMATDAPTAHGLSGHWWVMDELAQWPDTEGAQDYYTAISTAWPKTTGCRVVIITTAGSPEHWSYQKYLHAHQSELWTVSDIAGPAPWMSPAELEDERQQLTDSEYLRYFENQWTEPEDRLVRVEDLDACTTLPDEPLPYATAHKPYLISVDIGYARDRTSVAVSHRDDTNPDRPVIIDRLDRWKATAKDRVSLEAVEAHIKQMSDEYGHAQVLIDPYMAVQMTERLRDQHIRVTEHQFTPASNSALAWSLYQAIRDHTILLPDDPQLADELLHLRFRETQPGVRRIDHQPGRHDDMSITIAMATWWHHHQPKPWKPKPFGVYGGTKESVFTELHQPGDPFDRW
jgi:hypothetical protein